MEANSFLLKQTPFLEGTLCAEKQIGSHKSCLPLKMVENLPNVARTLKKCITDIKNSFAIRSIFLLKYRNVNLEETQFC